MKVFVRCVDRSEVGLTQPVIRRLKEKGYWCPECKDADRIIVAGDRREAIRDTLDYFEAGKKIWHLGGLDECEGDAYHYDGEYRRFISRMAVRSGGWILALSDHHSSSKLAFEKAVAVGPTMIDDLPDTSERPAPERYNLLCYNALPWDKEQVHLPYGNWYCMSLGNDKGYVNILTLKEIQPKALAPMPRPTFLRWLRHAEEVWGNSSCLAYEAPLWHTDDKIHLIGLRNKGRKIVRWDVEKQGSPSDNVVRALEAAR